MKLEKDILIPVELEINPYVYLDIVLKYEPYLKLINKFGGYMFIKHIYKFSKKSEMQTFKDIHSMEKSKILKILNVNNCSYVLLTKTSLRYLRQKPNVAFLQPPTSTQLKTCCYLAEYIRKPNEFFRNSKPYNWFLEKYKQEIQNYKNKNKDVDIKFLTNFKNKVKIIKDEAIKSDNAKDIFSRINASRIYFDEVNNRVITFLILDFDRSNYWLYKAMTEKIEPIIKKLSIYTGYNIKILTSNVNRKTILEKDIKKLEHKGVIFLKNIDIIDLNIDQYFNPSKQIENFLKDIDKLEIAMLQEKLKINSK